MTHPCHNCGTPVEDGVSFCPACNAPQIRVAAAEPTPVVAAPGTFAATLVPPAIQWRDGLRAALIAGIGAGIVSVLPIISMGVCLWMLAGGAAAVSIYPKRQPNDVVTTGMGARLGSVTGVFGFAVFAIFSALGMLIGGGAIREVLRRSMEQAARNNPDPRAQEIMQRLTSPEGMAMIVTITMIALFFAFVIFSAAGGALWAAMQPRNEAQK